jgi:amino acid transporter
VERIDRAFGSHDRQVGQRGPIVLSVLGVMCIYLAMNIGILGVMPVKAIMNSKFIGSDVMTILILITAFASVHTGLLGASRLPFNAARDGMFFRPFGKLHQTLRFPHISLLVMGRLPRSRRSSP